MSKTKNQNKITQCDHIKVKSLFRGHPGLALELLIIDFVISLVHWKMKRGGGGKKKKSKDKK